MCPLLWEQCIGRDILVLKDVPAKTRAALSDFTGARPISYLTQCSLVRSNVCRYSKVLLMCLVRDMVTEVNSPVVPSL